MSQCSVCASGVTIDDSKTNVGWAKQLGVDETTIRRHLQHAPKVTRDVDEPLSSGRAEYGHDGGDFTDVESDKPITDWTPVFERFNLPPDQFEIVGDTVRCSTWQQSRRTDDGDRDVIDLYSYRASFRRKTRDAVTDEDIDNFRTLMRGWKLPKKLPTVTGAPVAAVLNLADMQLAKSEGGGMEATQQRLTDGLENFLNWADRMRKSGHNINELVIVNNGDPFEGIAGNYANQTFTVQANLRTQQNAVLDVWQTFARELFPMFDRAQFVSVLCNHTQYGRQGGAKDSITGDSDSGGAFLAECLQRILSGRPEFDHVRFTIPHDNMNVYTDIAGVPVGFNHGHKIPGNDVSGFEKWLNGQARGDEQAHRARLWFTAHRHNFQSWDLGSTFAFSCPSCDGGSKWLRDTTGRFSRSGVLAVLVGEHHPLGWSDLAFL